MKDLDGLEMRVLRNMDKKVSHAATYGTGREPLDISIATILNIKQVIQRKLMATQLPPANQPLQMNSITKLQALVPVRVATSKVLEGNWSGRELNATRVVGSLFGGAHFIMQIGYNQQVGYTASFRLVFVAHMPLEKGQSLTDPDVIADAERMSESFMHMLNMRRVQSSTAVPTPTPGDSAPGHHIQGKRADVLIVDEISDIPPSKPYVAKLDDTLPGKRPV